MYKNDAGVAQDYVKTHKWFILSVSRPTVRFVRLQATNNRDNVAAELAAQADHVEVVHTLRQVVCVKG